MFTRDSRAPARARGASALLLALFLPACYRITTPGPARPTVAGPSHVMSTVLWGALEDNSFDAICGGNGAIAEVTATTPFLEGVATVLTLGIWAPIHVSTRCLALGASDAKK